MNIDREKNLALSIGAAIATRRKERGFTQEKLAEKLGIGDEQVSRLERGAVIATIPRLIEIAEALDCPALDLLGVASDLAHDQAIDIANMLKNLKPSDRAMVLGFVEELARRLADN